MQIVQIYKSLGETEALNFRAKSGKQLSVFCRALLLSLGLSGELQHQGRGLRVHSAMLNHVLNSHTLCYYTAAPEHLDRQRYVGQCRQDRKSLDIDGCTWSCSHNPNRIRTIKDLLTLPFFTQHFLAFPTQMTYHFRNIGIDKN